MSFGIHFQQCPEDSYRENAVAVLCLACRCAEQGRATAGRQDGHYRACGGPPRCLEGHWRSLPHLEGGAGNDPAASVLGTKVRPRTRQRAAQANGALLRVPRARPPTGCPLEVRVASQRRPPAEHWPPRGPRARTLPGSEPGSGSHGCGFTSSRETTTLGSKDAGSSPSSSCLLCPWLTSDFCPVSLSEVFRTSEGAVTLPRAMVTFQEGRERARGAQLHGGPLAGAAERGRRARAGPRGQAARSLSWPEEGRGLRSQARAGALTRLHACAEVFRCVSICSGPHTPVPPSRSLSFLGHFWGLLS